MYAWQPPGECLSQERNGDVVGTRIEADQESLVGFVLPQYGDGLADTFARHHGSLDLSQFDAMTAKFDLLIEPPDELDASVGEQAHLIAGPVHPLAGHVGVGKKFSAVRSRL